MDGAGYILNLKFEFHKWPTFSETKTSRNHFYNGKDWNNEKLIKSLLKSLYDAPSIQFNFYQPKLLQTKPWNTKIPFL